VYRAEDVQTLHEKLSKLSEENEQKSKVIQQYILRDNAKKLQLEEAQIKPVKRLIVDSVGTESQSFFYSQFLIKIRSTKTQSN
jgi:hypothetical protein